MMLPLMPADITTPLSRRRYFFRWLSFRYCCRRGLLLSRYAVSMLLISAAYAAFSDAAMLMLIAYVDAKARY